MIIANIKSGVQILLDPAEIQAKKNTRWDGAELNPLDVEEKCQSFEKHGQLQPVRVRKNGDKVELIFGFTRHAAAMLFNERHPDKPMKLKCVATSCNAEEALQESIVENRSRKNTTPMDDAFAQKRLREEHGWNDAQIAELYKTSASMVAKLKHLLSLSKSEQMQVHLREISFDAAMQLASLSEADRAEIAAADEKVEQEPAGAGLMASPKMNGHKKPTKSQRIKKAVRDKKIDKGGKQGRTLSEVRKFLDALQEKSATGADGDKVNRLCKLFLKFIEGGLRDDTMENKLWEEFA